MLAQPADKPVLVLDFDGTVCLGEGPVWAYAHQIGRLLPPKDAAELDAELAAYLSGGRPHSGWGDGYAAVQDLGSGRLTPEEVNRAYLASRQWLVAHPETVRAPDGLPELLADLPCRRVLVTNSPADSATATLARIGLVEVIDQVVGSAGKPDGFARVLTELCGDLPRAEVLSIGDFWANDIAPALRQGCMTAWLNPYQQDAKPAHTSASTIQELYPDLRAWANDPRGFADSHPVNLTQELS